MKLNKQSNQCNNLLLAIYEINRYQGILYYESFRDLIFPASYRYFDILIRVDFDWLDINDVNLLIVGQEQ